MKKFLVMLLILAGVFVAPSPVEAMSGYKLPVDTPTQDKSNFCWVAATAGIVKYLKGKSISQCNLVKAVTGKTTCPNQAGSFADVYDLFLMQGISAHYYYAPLSLSYIKKQINEGKPMAVSLKWPGRDVGHLIVIDGYVGNSLFVDYITMNKTYQIVVKYSDLLGNTKSKRYYANNGGSYVLPAHKWRATYYGFQRFRSW